MLLGDVVVQQLMISGVSILVLYIHVNCKPFLTRLENEIETVSLLFLNAICLVTMADMARAHVSYSMSIDNDQSSSHDRHI